MKTTDVLGCVGWAAGLLVASGWIPFVGPVIGLLTPIPFLYYSAKLGLRQGVVVTAVTVGVIGLTAVLAGYPQIILFAVEFSLLGIVLAELFKRGIDLGRTILFATLFMLLLGACALSFIALSRDMGPIQLVLAYLEDHLKAAITAYESMGMPQQNTKELEAFGKAIIHTISKIYPSLIILGTGFAVWLNVVVARPLFRMKNLGYPDFTPMDRWQAPELLIWGVIASGFSLFLMSGVIKLLAINALIVLLAVYLFQGLSILLFFLNKFRVPRLVRICIYGFVIIQQVLLGVLALAGLFDQWIDFRKIHRKANKESG
jgi:uncharacterized protein YybS (DUF2232 family)